MESNELTRVDTVSPVVNYLVVQRGPARLEVVDLIPGTRLTIGRSPGNRIVIPDPKCSRQHCEIYGRENRWFLRDLDSRNGVVVDGQRISSDWELELGQTISLGTCQLVLTDVHPDLATSNSITPSDPYAIIERKAGTQFDRPRRVAQEGPGASDLFQLARAMNAAVDTVALADCVLEGVMKGTNSDVGGILLFPSMAGGTDSSALRLISARGGENTGFSKYLSDIVLHDCEAILAHDIAENSLLMARDSITSLAARSAICAPVRHKGVVVGLIHLYVTAEGRALDADCLEFTLAVADQFASVLEAVREREQLAVGLSRVESQFQELRQQLAVETELVGRSPLLDKVRNAIARVAPTDATVMIRGESGVGKELVARAVHFNSARKTGPFVCVNCAALTETLLESELFGHEKGAFTGASAQKAGKFEQAHMGTIFLDEVGEMSPDIQSKFLRVLEGNPFERVGGDKAINVDVRVVTATNRNLEMAVREGKFRQDLFFRLQVIEVVAPPLREHPEDIPAITQHFLERFGRKSRVRVKGLNREAMELLKRHPWPGNVRELRNVIERAVILTDHEVLTPADITLSHIEANLQSPLPGETQARPATPRSDTVTERPTEPGPRSASPAPPPIDPNRIWFDLAEEGATLDEIDKLYIHAVLEHCKWNKSNAARLLDIERTTLDRRLKRYGLERPSRDEE
ncbi:Transcriptional regulatory protein ZraR [Caulifigura coniformis]|uniref:Transcriptional regulatory protein ZraR n=1 Tax=Caulifigura coniformis TaxID=2527983 RepID=A0A517SAJ7_9PLAN|nr:Transcriptional regulatory protein ZraR [Caulifigura coniformis]